MRIVNPTAILGENIACDYLKKLGFKILERNYRKTYGEIDIIALDKDVLAFIEVKTRTSNLFGSPLESITSWKLKSLIKTAQYYKMTKPNLPEALRIDAVSVLLDGDKVKSIELTRNISEY